MSKYFKHIEKSRISKHISFWIIWISSFTVLQSFGCPIHDYSAWLMYYLVTLPLFIAHTYIIAYWLLPRYFFKHRYFIFSFWIFVLLNLASVGELLISNEVVWKLVKPENMQQGNYLTISNILINGLGNEYIIIVFLSVKVIRFWNSKMGEKAILTDMKLASEIELIQYQYYPRFVLNVMDRLEVLALNKSSLTPDMIIRFSGMMNNLSSRQKSEMIPLQKEIDLIKNYIEIQNTGKPKNTKVRLKLSGKNCTLLIPPFLFFQLIEEAFSLLTKSSKKSDFEISFTIEPQAIGFSMTIWNENMLPKTFDSNVLDNFKKYLNYFYPENHKVISTLEINFVEINLEIHF